MSAAAASATATGSGLAKSLSNRSLRWAAGGWIFFIAENVILSENRTYLIERLGDDQYHLAYGTLSTIASASIGYGYYTLPKGRDAMSMAKKWTTTATKVPPASSAIGAWLFLTLGLTMASQTIPKLQIPISFVNNSTETPTTKTQSVGPTVPQASTSPKEPSSFQLQVRCPFDFSDKKTHADQQQNLGVTGLDRISRHPGLWSFGLAGIGQAFLVPTVPHAVWWLGPAAIAWVGGSHTDSRYRRNMGGTLPAMYDAQTSNVPFWAMICGKQGSNSFQQLVLEELKPLNAMVAVATSTLWVLRRVR